jgi:hypothetical protein
MGSRLEGIVTLDNKAFEVDWHVHRDSVVAQLPHGGTVYVSGPKAANHLFDRRLVDNWLTMCAERSWRHVRLWSGDGQSHQRSTVLEVAAQALGINLPQSQIIENTNVLTNNKATIMTVKENTINLFMDSRRDLESTQLRHLIDTIRQSTNLGLAIILPDAHRWRASQRQMFFTSLWDEKLAALGNRVIVFVIHMPGKFEHESGTFPPPPTLTLNLEKYFDRESESGRHAIEDIAQHALERNWEENSDSAISFARGLLYGCNNIDSLYRKLGRMKFESKVDHNNV